MNQYKICMGMWNSFSPLMHINISQEQQRDKKRINLKTRTGETIKSFYLLLLLLLMLLWGMKGVSKGGGVLRVTEVQPQQVSDPASFQ